MKNVSISILLTLLLVSLIHAQSPDPFPQGMKYQALARDLSGEIMADQNVLLKIHLKDSIAGEVFYTETHSVFTNEFGLFSLVVGQGTIEAGEFSDIPWSTENIWIEIEIQNQGGVYETIGNSILLAVPYAFHSMGASEIKTVPGEADANWLTTGNANTDTLNFLGTTDSTDLIFRTDSIKRLTLSSDGKNTINGQVTIVADIPFGYQSDYDDYPLRVEGGDQGIAIKLLHEDIYYEQNFITFFNESDEALGRIEGGIYDFAIIRQLLKDIFNGVTAPIIKGEVYDLNNPAHIATLRDIYFHDSFTHELLESAIQLGYNALNLTLSTIVAICTGGIEEDPLDVIVGTIDLSVEIGQYISLVHSGTQNGIIFESGGADYAEWLEKAYPDERIRFGEVVGVKGGLISKSFTEADQFLAITSNPIIVGNMPSGGNENNFEKVALMGQVPVMVFGVVAIGDYILPSGYGDGYGMAVNPEEMKASDFSKIIGVAWSGSDDQFSYNLINTAVGFNTNHLGVVVNQMQQVINTMQMELAKLNPDYQPVYFDNTKTSMKNNDLDNEEFALMMMEYCPDCDGFGRETIKCYIKCWINTADASGIEGNGNAIRAIVKKVKPDGYTLNGQDISVPLEVLKLFADNNVFPTIDYITNSLFAEGGLIDIDALSANDDIPESITDLLTGIKNGTLINDYPNIESLTTVNDDWAAKIGYLQALAGENE